GVAINPMIVDGQIQGAVYQGIAGTLFEHIQYDADGQLLTGSLLDYHLPIAREMPSVRIAHLESPDLTVPGGFKGMAEGGTIGAPAAIASAIADAFEAIRRAHYRDAGDANDHSRPDQHGRGQCNVASCLHERRKRTRSGI